MTDIIDTDTISTVAGDYTVTWMYDQDSESPLPDDGSMAFYIAGHRGDVYADTTTVAGDAGATLRWYIANEYRYGTDIDAVIRRYEKWRAITGSPWQLVTGSGNGSMQSHWWNWLVLVLAEGENAYTDPVHAANATMDTYQAWASGDVAGFILADPQGEDIESVWGFMGDDGRAAARESYIEPAIAYDVAERAKRANLVGAGFVGLI